MKHTANKSSYSKIAPSTNTPLTMYMLTRTNEEGRTARPSQNNHIKTYNLLKEDKAAILSTFTRPLWKKEISKTHRNNQSHKRISTLPNQQLSNQDKITSLIQIFSPITTNNFDDCITAIGQKFKKAKKTNKQSWIRDKSTIVSKNDLEVSHEDYIDSLVKCFEELFKQITQIFLNEHISLIEKYQESVYQIGKQYDNLSNQYLQQQQVVFKYQYKLNKLIMENIDRLDKGIFLTKVIQQMELNDMNVESWISRSQTFYDEIKKYSNNIEEQQMTSSKQFKYQKQKNKQQKKKKNINLDKNIKNMN